MNDPAPPRHPQLAVSAAIFRQGKILLVRRARSPARGVYTLPGGRVEFGESLHEAVAREVLEETGLRVEIKRLIGVYSDPRDYNIAAYPDGNVLQGVSFLFECVRVDGDLRISHESTDIGYFRVDNLPERTLLSHVNRIRDATDSASGPFIR